MNNPVFNRLILLQFIAWRNIWRNPIRSGLTISALAGGLIMLILYAALLEGMSRQMVTYATDISSSHLQMHRSAYIDNQDIYATLPWSYLTAFEDSSLPVKIAPRLYAAALASSKDNSTGVMIKAIDPQREHHVTKLLSHLRSGEASFEPKQKNALTHYPVLVGAQLARNLQLSPGSELVLVTQAIDGSIGNAIFEVTGVLKPLEPNFDRMGVLMSIKAYQSLMYQEDGFHELAIKAQNIDELNTLQKQLQTQITHLQKQTPLDELGGKVIIRNWKELNPPVADMLELSGTMLLIVGLIVIGLASLGMINTMLMSVHERTHEFGTLLAIGMKARWILLMVVIESFYLALISAVIGSIIGSVIAKQFEDKGIDFSHMMPDGYDWAGVVFEPVMKGYLIPEQVFQASLLMILLTMLAALIPSWRIVRLKPAEVI
ncbi:ABC transporter permease YtrF [Hydrogenovibrio crunogenus]|uniref:ABC transporter permease YtrF n=1 Tax=Hydrogenovibrio crunogenus TaxID=39765 RepID=A0A4P7NXW5_9GAMM|nr:FtsX-like permease family protein [Hydrogenovibrio crunogenus]QBZ82418.1 ABC transporter permease YtrF [Hydrogenovibrio crunogenus]